MSAAKQGRSQYAVCAERVCRAHRPSNRNPSMNILDNVVKNPLIASRAWSTAAIGLETLFRLQHRVAPPNHGLARDKSVLHVDVHTQGLVKGRQSAAITEARGCCCAMSLVALVCLHPRHNLLHWARQGDRGQQPKLPRNPDRDSCLSCLPLYIYIYIYI